MLKYVLILIVLLAFGVNLVSAQVNTLPATCADATLPSGITITVDDLSASTSNIPNSASIMNDIGINPQVLLNVAANFGDIPAARADFANPDTNLTPKENAIVTYAGDQLKVYEGECTESQIVGQLPSGTSVLVMEGPYASEGLAWWHVQHKGLIGWVVEGQEDEIWLSGS